MMNIRKIRVDGASNDDEYNKRADEYYRRKLERAEEISPYLALLCVAALLFWVGYSAWQAVEHLLT